MTSNVLSQWSALHRKLAGLSEAFHEPGGWLPPTDVIESARGLVVRMELAGVVRSDLRIRVEGRALIVEGLREAPCCTGRRFRQLEMEHGAFRRIVPLPFAVTGAKAKAELADGLLQISLPRTKRPTGEKMVMLVMTT